VWTLKKGRPLRRQKKGGGKGKKKRMRELDYDPGSREKKKGERVCDAQSVIFAFFRKREGGKKGPSVKTCGRPKRRKKRVNGESPPRSSQEKAKVQHHPSLSEKGFAERRVMGRRGEKRKGEAMAHNAIALWGEKTNSQVGKYDYSISRKKGGQCPLLLIRIGKGGKKKRERGRRLRETGGELTFLAFLVFLEQPESLGKDAPADRIRGRRRRGNAAPAHIQVSEREKGELCAGILRKSQLSNSEKKRKADCCPPPFATQQTEAEGGKGRRMEKSSFQAFEEGKRTFGNRRI